MKRLIVIACSLVATVVFADEHFVSLNGSHTSPYTNWATATSNVNDAVQAAANGETIWVTNGVYRSPGPAGWNAAIYFSGGGNNKTLRSVNGPLVTILDGNYPNVTNTVITLVTVVTNITISGFTITNGYGSGGGAGILLTSAKSILITNCIITGNQVPGNPTYGGGIYMISGTVRVVDCQIIGNSVVYGGGICFLTSGNVVSNCLFKNNRALSGGDSGGVWLGNGNSLVDCRVLNNTAGSGGGVGSMGSGSIISGGTIASNTASTFGGGVNMSGGTLQYCMIASNTASTTGGGVSKTGGSVQYCIISNNYSGTTGGGIYTSQDPSNILFCTIVNNNALTSGGGLHVAYDAYTLTVRNCLIMGNSSANGGGVWLTTSPRIENCTIAGNTATTRAGGVHLEDTGASLAIVNTIIKGNTDANASPGSCSNLYAKSATGLTGIVYTCTSPTNRTSYELTGAGVSAANPLFEMGTYRLQSGSPCIDTGINQGWMTSGADLDGLPRLDHFRYRVDMGAYEYLPRGTIIKCH